MSDILIITKAITRVELQSIAGQCFGDMVKVVIDCQKRIMAIGGELHADEEALLLNQGSRQEDLWGINLYPEIYDDSWLEFDSMINIRPRQGNRSRSIESQDIQKQIRVIVNQLILI